MEFRADSASTLAPLGSVGDAIAGRGSIIVFLPRRVRCLSAAKFRNRLWKLLFSAVDFAGARPVAHSTLSGKAVVFGQPAVPG
jgi:hypothetical protein